MSQWRPIPSFPLYEASDAGEIRRRVAYPSGKGPGRILRASTHVGGYLYVSPGRGTHVGIHVMVCEAFHGNKPERWSEAGHRDGNPVNNIPSNLRWITRKQQGADKSLHGTTNRGQKCTFSKLTPDQVLEIRASTGLTQRQLARKFGVSQPAIGCILRREVWTHV